MSNDSSEGIAALIILALLIIVGGCNSCVSISKPSDGARAGTLAKFSQKGWVWDTWEGELRVSGSVAEPWEFSVNDPQIIESLKSMVGKEIELSYHQGIVWAWNGETSYLAQSVKLLNTTEQK